MQVKARGGNCMRKMKRNKTGDVTRAGVTQVLVSHIESLKQFAFLVVPRVEARGIAPGSRGSSWTMVQADVGRAKLKWG